ncbi:MAG: hypothetical protein LBG19_06460 [Prevotellaceae bacterium]|jgi:hypothetical protein|nr:hypothetical protein [Prevotellaceae bacterium]
MIDDSKDNEPRKSIYKSDDGLPSSDFGLLEQRSFPMSSAAHVRTAETFFKFAEKTHKPLLAYRILLKAREYKVAIRDAEVIAWAKKYIDENLPKSNKR